MSKYIIKCKDGTVYNVTANCPSHAQLRAFFKHKQTNSNTTRIAFYSSVVSIETNNKN